VDEVEKAAPLVPSDSLADTLASAMASRRAAVAAPGPASVLDEGSDDSEWSD
jgi:hypothetical protein